MAKRIPTLIVLLLLVGLGAWFGLRRSSSPSPAPVAPPPSVTETRPTQPLSPPITAPSSIASRPLAETTGDQAETTSSNATAKPSRPGLDDILAADDPDLVTTAKKLAKLVLDPTRPLAERDEALAHTLNLAAGNEADVLTPMIQDANLTADQCRTILGDALNQSLDYQSDIYLEALRNRREADLRKEIRDHLAFLTDGDDLGDNVDAWRKALADAKAKRDAQ